MDIIDILDYDYNKTNRHKYLITLSETCLWLHDVIMITASQNKYNQISAERENVAYPLNVQNFIHIMVLQLLEFLLKIIQNYFSLKECT